MDQRSLHVLLVEDDDIDIMNVQRAFEKNHILNPLHLARNGIEGLAKLRDGSVGRRRIVLLDLNMPRMNGIEFLAEIRKDPELQALTVVVLTTSNEERDKVDAYRYNVSGYVVKPVTFVKFVDVMATLNKYWTLVELP